MLETTKDLKNITTGCLNSEDIPPETDTKQLNNRESAVLCPGKRYPKTKLKYKKIRADKSRPYNWVHAASADKWDSEGEDEATRDLRRRFRHYPHFLRCLEYYQLQPVEIPFRDGEGKRCKYEPLALLTFSKELMYSSMKPVLVDVRSRGNIRQNWDWLYPAWRAANRFAREKGWNFRLVRDEFFRSPLYVNASFLLRYRSLTLNGEYFSRLMREIRSLKTMTVHQLLENVSRDKTEYAEMLPQIWRLVDANYVFFDVREPLKMGTVIYRL